ncbi:MAG: hypothetical protein JNK49_14360 [Planctomycetes bacterium]|nr:hypothetical protein [Planctomycetota bacterium]
MNSMLRSGFVLLSLAAAAVCAQGDTLPVRKTGAVYREEVDGLVRLLRETATRANLPALGGDSVLATAQILAAMGHCHRFYDLHAGPVVRPSLHFVLKHRKADGGFGDAATTVWVADALAAYDTEGYRTEIAAARRWLAQHGAGEAAAPAGLEPAVLAVLGQVRADVFPQDLARDAAQRFAAWKQAPEGLDRGAAAAALVQLVACQIANRRLDQQGQQEPAAAAFSPAQQKGFEFLIGKQKDGVFSVQVGKDKVIPHPGFTALALLALQTKPKALRSAAEQATIDQGLRWLCSLQAEDGTIGQEQPNYITCAAVAALARWHDPSAKPVLQKAQKAILGFQNLERSGYTPADPDYGSIGYGGGQRGDLSNLHFSLEALRATGLPADHEAFQKALVFLQRTQNLKSRNDFAGKVKDPDRGGQLLDVTSGDDGGASYYPGNSAAGYLVLPDGKSVPRSYGSMTYALLKSYTLSGLSRDDERVQAAVRWVSEHWDLASNPGADPALGEKVKFQGLFYYYMVLGQALDLAGLDTVQVPGPADEQGQRKTEAVAWRKALRAQLEGMQLADGSWLNGQNGRWYESQPVLCTCYALTALERCR